MPGGRPGEIGCFGVGRRQPEARDVLAAQHQRLGEDEVVVDDQPDRHDHEPSACQAVPPREAEGQTDEPDAAAARGDDRSTLRDGQRERSTITAAQTTQARPATRR